MYYDKNQLLKIAAILLCVFLFGGLLAGCDNQGAPKSSGRYDELVNDINEVQVRIKQEYLLTKASPEETDSVLEGLRLIQNGFSILNRDPSDVSSIRAIDRGINLITRFYKQERDFPVLMPLLQRASRLLVEVAERVGVPLSFRIPIFQTEFSNFDLASSGFEVFPEGSWNTRQVINGIRQIASFSSPPFGPSRVERSWLILPPMDLTSVRRPAFRLEHGISLARGDNSAVFNKLLFQLKSFKLKISTTYAGGVQEPWAMRDCELVETRPGSGRFRRQQLGEECDWMTYDVGATEMQTDRFFQRFTDVIELDEFRNRNVSIAFVVDQTPMIYEARSCDPYYSPITCTQKLADPVPLGNHRLSWDLHSFELVGTGKVEFPKDTRESMLLEHSFASNEVIDHKILIDPSFNRGNRTWLPGGRGGPPMLWVKIEAESDFPKSAGLLSPVYDLSGTETLKWSLRENIRWDWPEEVPLSFDSTEILYSYDYQGGDIQSANWIRVERAKPANRFRRASWSNNYTVEGIELDPERTGRVTFLFWMQSDLEMTWQIEDYRLLGVGQAITSIPYTTEPSIEGPWREEPPEAGESQSAGAGGRR